MTPLPLVVPDTDDTRRRIVEALAWASGIHRDDIALVSAEARTRWHILADHTLTTLRLMSVTHRDGLEDAEVGAILRRAQQAEANRDFDRQQYERPAPDAWRGYCTRGPCAAEDGHAGTCAEASGWADEPDPLQDPLDLEEP